MVKKKKSKSAKAKPIAKSTKKRTITMTSLRKWNMTLAGIHAFQGIIILIVSRSVTFPIMAHHLTIDSLASDASKKVVLAPASQHLFDLSVAWLVAIFFFMSAIAHFLMSTIYRKKYETDLKVGINRVRWIEYSFSASTMLVAIGLLTGVYDVSSLLMIFVLCLVMNMLGLVMEVHNQTTNKVNWLSYFVGCIAGAIPWLVFAIYFWGSNIYGAGRIPTFVYWIYGSIFITFMSFALNMYLQYRKKGRWSNYLYGERMYMVLSLVAKTALAWQIFAGTLRP